MKYSYIIKITTVLSLLIFTVSIMQFLYVSFADAATTGTGSAAQFKNPIAATTVDAALGNVLTAIQNIVAVLAVLMILVGGVLYITAAGDSGRIGIAKAAITSALIGLAIALAAPSFLKEIYGILGGGSQSGIPTGTLSLTQIATKTIATLSSFVGILTVIMLVVGGIMYITSAGDSGRTDTAKNIIKFAIIGLIISLIALILVSDVIGIFGATTTP